MSYVYLVFCIVGWSWAVVVAVILGLLSLTRRGKADARGHGFDVLPTGESPQRANARESLKEA